MSLKIDASGLPQPFHYFGKPAVVNGAPRSLVHERGFGFLFAL
jgi:hypothetical protein